MPESSLWLITTRQQRTKGSNYPIQQAAILPRRQQLQFKGRYKQSFSPPFHGQLKLLNTKETSPANPYGSCDMLPFFHTITFYYNDSKRSPTAAFSSVQPVCVQQKRQHVSCKSPYETQNGGKDMS